MKNQKLENSLKQIAKTSFIAFLFILSSKVFTYLYRIIIARQFGPEIYGLFSLAIMISGWFIAIFSFGIPEGITRFVSLFRGKKETRKTSYLLQVSIIFLFISGLISALILFFLSSPISIRLFNNYDLIVFLRWFSISIPIALFASIFLSVLVSFEKTNKFSFARNFLDTSTKLVFILIFTFLGLRINSIIFSYILGILAMLIFSYYSSKPLLSGIFKNQEISPKLKKKIRKNLFSYSWPLMFVGIISFIFSWIDSFMIGYFNIEGKGVYNVGIYNSAVPIAALLIIAPSLFIQLFFPLITKEYAQKNNNLIKEISKQITKWIFLLNLPVLIIMFLFPGALINLFFGKDYINAAFSLRFLALGIFFYSIFIISENLISMAGKSKIVLFDILLASLINIILNIFLVPKYNINGAAFSTMVTYIIWSLISLLQARHYVSIIPLKRKMFFILLISAIPTLLLVFIKQFIPITLFSLIIQGSLFFLFYFFLVIYSCLDRNDWMILRAIRNKIKNRGL